MNAFKVSENLLSFSTIYMNTRNLKESGLFRLLDIWSYGKLYALLYLI